jgi:hypothetical protein
MSDPENAASYIRPMVTYFGDQIPGILAGDIAAVIVAAITGGRQ